jgi:hypothetical protein
MTQQGTTYHLKIYDFTNDRLIYEHPIKNRLLSGILKSGLFTFADGHIYFNNNAIKVRYDLISNPNNRVFKENEVFDFYSDVISYSTGGNQRIKSDTPMDCIQAHRFVYVSKDRSKANPQYISFCPYPHER